MCALGATTKESIKLELNLVSKHFLHLLPVHFQVLLDFPGRLAGIVTTIVFLQTILSTTLYSTHRVLAERTQGMAVS